ncbi:alkaline phosphatase family protein [Hassallia byssoidea VB512170]|uniref:Alkaline phosphatase family protein n=1 Tax=Hassallia byssoidea VB512170 TaxID=1304833 RepID=A0A846HAA7_9CYAN|nr:alkaline phosphatase family protein [Hassalia byssoidea]NEU74276.1 alkaline phosphatase family protein [Hassalia byssoidea VB512170]
MRIFTRSRRWLILTLFVIALVAACNLVQPAKQHNVVIFVADGLRPTSINSIDMPTLNEIREQGVTFVNSHSLFPTFTTANASAIATGHYLGDTGDFSNTIKVSAPVKSAKNSLVPFLENNAVLKEVNKQFGNNFINEESLLATARKANFSTAAVGKIGPVLIQDVTHQKGEPTIIFDDATGTPTGIALSEEITPLLTKASLPTATPSRGANGKPGDSKTPGTKVANTVQQQYFADVTTKVILPLFQQRKKPFVLVYWSRDPDGTQHNHGDSLNQIVPGINGSTVLAARQNVDNNLAQIRTKLKDLGLETTTNIFVTADHGFSTISKESKTSYAKTLAYSDVPKGFLPPGFVAIDLAHDLKLSLFDPDNKNALINPTKGQFSKNSLIAKDPNNPDIIVAGNGGSDLIYLPNVKNNKVLAKKIVDLLLKQDYVSGLFVDDILGSIPGTLPSSAIKLRGTARTPHPSIVVNFRSFDTGCGNPTACGVEIADTALQQGQGMHGSFSRADTYNTMAAIGPDFKQKYQDTAPTSNADVAPTLAKVLKLKLPSQGKLVGRVLSEALTNGVNIKSQSQTLESQVAANGLKTILKYQTVGGTRYFDTAGFPGRTVGL